MKGASPGSAHKRRCYTSPAQRPTATAAGRNRSSPSPHEARTGRGVSELGQQPSSPRPSPPLVYLFSVVGTSRCDVRAACSGATTSIAGVAWIFVPPATTRAGTAQRAIPTIALNAFLASGRPGRASRPRNPFLKQTSSLWSVTDRWRAVRLCWFKLPI